MKNNSINLIIPEKLSQFPLLQNIKYLDGLIMSAEIYGDETGNACPRQYFLTGLPKRSAAIIVVIDGSITMEINGNSCQGKAGSVFIMLDFQVFGAIKVSNDFKAYHLIGNLEFIRSSISKFHFKTNTNIIFKLLYKSPLNFKNSEFNDLISDIENFIANISRKNFNYRNFIIQNNTATIFFDILNNIDQDCDFHFDAQDDHIELVIQFIENVINNCKKERRVNFYAEKACLSPDYFSRVIKKSIGKTVSEIIRYETIKQCEMMLADNKFTIKEIGIIMNFSCTAEFVKYFSQHSNGLTPRQYRLFYNNSHI